MNDTSKFPKLLKEFSLDPECFSTFEEFVRIIQGLGMSEGRYVADIPNSKWRDLLENDLTRKFPAEETRVRAELEMLSRSKGFLETRINANSSWLTATLLEDQDFPFDGIITRKCEIPNRSAPNQLSTREGPWHREAGTRLPKKAEALADVAAQIFRISDEIKFVDPYFNPRKSRYTASLQVLLNVAATCKKKYERLEYHCTIDKNEVPNCIGQGCNFELENWIKQFESDCETLLSNKIPHPLELTFIVWMNKPNQERMHARYILSEHTGIRFDYGLDLAWDEISTDVDLVSPSVHRSRWDELCRKRTTYGLVRFFTLKGRGKKR